MVSIGKPRQEQEEEGLLDCADCKKGVSQRNFGINKQDRGKQSPAVVSKYPQESTSLSTRPHPIQHPQLSLTQKKAKGVLFRPACAATTDQASSCSLLQVGHCHANDQEVSPAEPSVIRNGNILATTVEAAQLEGK